MHKGVFPVPPKYILPTEIIGMENFFFFLKVYLKLSRIEKKLI